MTTGDDAAADRFRRDVQAIRQYGSEHPEAWTGVRRKGDRLVALFTEPDAHRDAVRARVAHPDALDVVGARYTERYLASVLAEVRAVLRDRRGSWSTSGSRVDAVAAGLRGGYDELAQQLHDRFGDALELTVGLHRFPLDPDAVPPTPRPAPESTVEVPGLQLETVPDAADFAVRGQVKGQVVVTNVATTRLLLRTGQPLTGVLVVDGVVVSGSSGFVAGTGRAIDLEPAQSTTVTFSAGTDTLDPRQGTTLPAGRYELVVIVPLHDRGRDARAVTPPVPVALVG